MSPEAKLVQSILEHQAEISHDIAMLSKLSPSLERDLAQLRKVQGDLINLIEKLLADSRVNDAGVVFDMEF